MSKAHKHVEVEIDVEVEVNDKTAKVAKETPAAVKATAADTPAPKCDVCPDPAVAEYIVACGDKFYRCQPHTANMGFNAAQAAVVRRLDVPGDEAKPCG